MRGRDGEAARRGTLRRLSWRAAVLLLASGSSCTTLLGVDGDYQPLTGAGGAHGSGQGTAGAGAGTQDCPAGLGDCDGDGTCETKVDTLQDCGGCGRVCNNVHGVATCTGGACVFTCDLVNDGPVYEAYGDCDGDGSNGCESVLDTQKNCGVCGHDCLGGECAKGKPYTCQPLTLASGQDGPMEVVVDQQRVYWTAGGSVLSVPKGGGGATTVAGGQPDKPRGLAVDASRVYFAIGANAPDGEIRSVGLDGGSVTILVPGLGWAPRIAADADSLYWKSGTTVMKVAKTGGPPAQVTTVTDSGQTGAIAVDGSSVYWTHPNWDTETEGEVAKAPVGGGAATVLASGQYMPHGIAIDKTSVYWTNRGDWVDSTNRCGGSGGVFKVGLDGSALTTLVAGGACPHSIAVDSGFVYWTDRGAGTVSKIPLAGGDEVVLASAQDVPHGITVDDKAVYWTTKGGGTVMKLAK